MSNVAYKSNLEPNKVHREAEQHKKQILRRGQMTLGEKVIITIALAIVLVVAFRIISVQAQIYTVNQEIQTKEKKIVEQQKSNEDLKVEVKDLGRYERILKIAKEKGLKLDGDNVKVVDGQ